MTGSIGEMSYVAIPWTGDYAYGGSVLIQSGNVSAQGGIGSGGGGGGAGTTGCYRDWETDRKSTRLNSSHSRASRMPSSA